MGKGIKIAGWGAGLTGAAVGVDMLVNGGKDIGRSIGTAIDGGSQIYNWTTIARDGANVIDELNEKGENPETMNKAWYVGAQALITWLIESIIGILPSAVALRFSRGLAKLGLKKFFGITIEPDKEESTAEEMDKDYKSQQVYTAQQIVDLEQKVGLQAIKKLQKNLKDLEMYDGGIDGKITPALVASLQTAFRENMGYTGRTDGQLDVVTLQYITRVKDKLGMTPEIAAAITQFVDSTGQTTGSVSSQKLHVLMDGMAQLVRKQGISLQAIKAEEIPSEFSEATFPKMIELTKRTLAKMGRRNNRLYKSNDFSGELTQELIGSLQVAALIQALPQKAGKIVDELKATADTSEKPTASSELVKPNLLPAYRSSTTHILSAD